MTRRTSFALAVVALMPAVAVVGLTTTQVRTDSFFTLHGPNRAHYETAAADTPAVAQRCRDHGAQPLDGSGRVLADDRSASSDGWVMVVDCQRLWP